MKLSRKWINEEYADLSHISDQEFIKAMELLGHRVTACRQIDVHGFGSTGNINYDTVIDLEISINRPDCHTMIGIAREAAAAFNIPLKLHIPAVKGNDEESIYERLDVDISDEWLCNRFSVRMAKNIKVAPSPKWLSDRLVACGINPINNIIDITNYVYLEYGLRVFAYDYRCISSGRMLVRNADDGESIQTSDGCVHHLEYGTPIVTDDVHPIGIAGITCVKEAEISEDTTEIIFEAAHYNYAFLHNNTFDPKLSALFSEQSDYQQESLMTVPALERTCELVERLQCGEVLDGIIDILNYVPEPITLDFDINAISLLLSTELSKGEICSYLNRLQINVDGDTILIPSFRTDLKTIKDIALEVNRIHALSNIFKK